MLKLLNSVYKLHRTIEENLLAVSIGHRIAPSW